jgi:twitching motility protein PilT
MDPVKIPDAPLRPRAGVADELTLDELLEDMARMGASDLHLKPKRPPLMRVGGRLVARDGIPPLDPGLLANVLAVAIPARMREALEARRSIEFGYGLPGVARFRASVFFQRGTIAAVFRRVPFEFRSLEDWGLPRILDELCELQHGLVLITGSTGSGKSSTLAALLRRIAATREQHIVTIEDPIEFLIRDDVASVSQREVGTDTPSVADALHDALRQDPDVIMVGEMRDQETIRTVLTAAETGHFVLSTLHTNGAEQTVDRILSTFPDGSHRQIRQQLSEVLEAVVTLQLVPRADGEGMIAAVEVMRRTPQVSKLILEGDVARLREEIESSVAFHKMQTMNQSLAALVIQGAVRRQTAITASPNPADLDLLLRKVVGVRTGAGAEGPDMADCLSDFSRIVELQEVKKLYDDLQERYDREIRSREADIEALRGQVETLSDRTEENARITSLAAENEHLRKQIDFLRGDYEGKIERLNNRVRELSGKITEAAAKPAEPAKGLFRR